MAYLIAGLVVFFGAHLYSALRSREAGAGLVGKLGAGPYRGLYSIVSLVGFGLIIYGFGQARPSPIIYSPPVWTQHINMLLMVFAMVLIVASNFPAGYIKKATKHPMLVAIKLWALGHLLANGELNSLLLFGAFLAFAVFDRIAMKKRGDNGPTGEVSAMWDVVSVVLGLGAYVAFMMYLHPILFGVSVMPG